jgi:Tol biopolymer transport system component/DNA-binding winged helix-turn-helix (wHTH) protein
LQSPNGSNQQPNQSAVEYRGGEMEEVPPNPPIIRFGTFELDLEAGELRKNGLKVKLHDQPFQILAMLLERPGRLVSREELQKRLWPADTFVDFEHSLNAAVKKLRQALGDDADNPRFVETLARRGYRFIAPVVGEGSALPREPRGLPYQIRGWATALLATAIAAALGIWMFQSRKERSEAPLIPVPLTSYPGYENCPSFSPDGSQVAFQWCTEEPAANCDIYIKQIGTEPPFRLTTDPAEDFSPAWSPDGKFIAFLRNLSPARKALMLVPQRGGAEQLLGECDIAYETDRRLLAWTPDSKWLVLPWREAGKSGDGLFLFNVKTREARRLTTWPLENAPAFSPDGRTLVFNRIGPPDSIYLLRLSKDYRPEGEPERFVPAAESSYRNFGIAWSSDSSDIVFSSHATGTMSLWRVATSPGARPRRLTFASEGASTPAVSRRGERLAYVLNRTDGNIWRLDFRSPGQNPGAPTRLIASTRGEANPAYSPDGKRIAFRSDRTGGVDEAWVCASDGSNPVQLTAGVGEVLGTPQWSPDGRSIALDVIQAENEDVYVVSANGGPVRRLTTHPAADKWPSWSRDGRWLYFCSNRSGWGGIWKVPANGGEAVHIIGGMGPEAEDVPQESSDGKFVYYEKGWPAHCSVWRVPVAGGEEAKVIDSTHTYAGWAVGKQGIYFFTPPDELGRSDICFYEFSTGKTNKIITIDREVGYRIAISPDERTILYRQLDQAGSDLMLVENFR